MAIAAAIGRNGVPKGSAVAEVENKLKREYPGNDHAVFGVLNKVGLMHGNKPTEKGLKKAHKHAEGGAVETKHDGTKAGTPEKRMHKDDKTAKRFGTKSRNRTGNDLSKAKDYGKVKQALPGVKW
jgi:hypothetical protein